MSRGQQEYKDTINSYMNAMDEAGGSVPSLMKKLYNSEDLHDLICNMAANGVRFVKSEPSLGAKEAKKPESEVFPPAPHHVDNPAFSPKKGFTFQVGDLVRVKKPKDIVNEKDYRSTLDPDMEICWVDEMDSLQNWHCVVEEIDEGCGYKLSVNTAYFFLPEWMELVRRKEDRPYWLSGTVDEKVTDIDLMF